MTFQDILAKYRAVSFSERDKGDRFERLMQAFLQTVPWYAGTFRHVWLWREFPYKQNLGGIDKPAVDSFLATSSKQFVNDQHRRPPLRSGSGYPPPTNGQRGGKRYPPSETVGTAHQLCRSGKRARRWAALVPRLENLQ